MAKYKETLVKIVKIMLWVYALMWNWYYTTKVRNIVKIMLVDDRTTLLGYNVVKNIQKYNWFIL